MSENAIGKISSREEDECLSLKIALIKSVMSERWEI